MRTAPRAFGSNLEWPGIHRQEAKALEPSVVSPEYVFGFNKCVATSTNDIALTVETKTSRCSHLNSPGLLPEARSSPRLRSNFVPGFRRLGSNCFITSEIRAAKPLLFPGEKS